MFNSETLSGCAIAGSSFKAPSFLKKSTLVQMLTVARLLPGPRGLPVAFLPLPPGSSSGSGSSGFLGNSGTGSPCCGGLFPQTLRLAGPQLGQSVAMQMHNKPLRMCPVNLPTRSTSTSSYLQTTSCIGTLPQLVSITCIHQLIIAFVKGRNAGSSW